MESSNMMNSVKKTIVYAGKNELSDFQDGSKITFHFTTHVVDENGDVQKECVDDSKKINRPMEIILGKQFKMPIWEKCLETMNIGEVAKFTVPKSFVDAYPLVSKSFREFTGISKSSKSHCCGMMAFSEGLGHSDLDSLIRDPKDLQFTLELVKVEHPGEYKKEAWSMDPEEKLKTVPQLKESGNQLYRQEDYDEASKKYAEAIGLLEQLILREKPGDKEWTELENLKIPILCNYAQCKLLLKDYYPVIDATTTILEKDPKNVKALYRRGKAFVGTWDLENAQKDFDQVAKLDPSFKSIIQKELKNLAKLQKEKDSEIKSKLCGKMFGDKK